MNSDQYHEESANTHHRFSNPQVVGEHDESNYEGMVRDYKPISDLLYDWVTVLKSKSKGVEIYGQFIQDALERKADKCVNLFQKLQQQDSEQIEEIKRHLAFMLSKEVPDQQGNSSVH